ncbi:YdcF family protein [Pedobacter sp. ISL-68]|uniref:YdcF family protein n=1 Tax=unclassified Pedobacter TaxID=2628915 RepID=UPI001BE9EE8A|nr:MULTISPECIES: YdcF family protein [unclassified Pedobacter]MBT2564290.1 YdcF family protein [Pedobacter sp. ISL-64]MBT2593110.1 YdcF family protein [Pedobacter sp. ISL-68]
MKPLYTFFLFCLFWQGLSAQDLTSQSYQLIKTRNEVQYKNYYLLSLFQQLPELRKMLSTDTAFSNIYKSKTTQVNEAVKTCKTDISCYAKALKFNNEEIAHIGNRLALLYTENNALGNLVKNHLIPSGCYAMFAKELHKTLLVKAWEQDANAINYAIGVYVEGNKPNYPKIDSISFSLTDKAFTELTSASALLSLHGNNKLFFEPAMLFALEALELNERKEAADYEPMAKGVNLAAINQIKKTDWEKYPYSVILVPGAGPEEKDVALSAGGMIRCRLAAIQYKKGVAPFIVVSGGRVHPYKTKFSEAYEMKKFLMEVLQIPESALIMEPHARHTTTNLRNCARLMFRYGMPVDKPGLACTVKSQSYNITNLLPERCKKELGYYPYKNGKRLSDTESEFYLNTASLQIDFDEPLDP